MGGLRLLVRLAVLAAKIPLGLSDLLVDRTQPGIEREREPLASRNTMVNGSFLLIHRLQDVIKPAPWRIANFF